ncbi:MAG: MoaD/ThiS family protein [Syntrophaceae bacterium]|nr:MoaD/ThiS family protein [Syntrophaceae bacterium]
MIVTVEALMNLGRALGWNNREFSLPDGSKLKDLLKAIEVPGKGNVYEMIVGADGKLDDHYTLMLDEHYINEGTFDREMRDRDRLVMIDTVNLPGTSFLGA